MPAPGLFGQCRCRLTERHYFAAVLPNELESVASDGEGDEAGRAAVIAHIDGPLVAIDQLFRSLAHVDIASPHNVRAIGRKRVPRQKRRQLSNPDRFARLPVLGKGARRTAEES